MEKCLRVLELMKSQGGKVEGTIDPMTGKVVWEPAVVALLGRLAYRMPAYISRIRTVTHLNVDKIREGKKVVAYQLAAVVETPATVTESV
jgi:hypothetical protein